MRLRLLFSLRQLRAVPLFIALLSTVMLAGVQEASCKMHGLGAVHAGAQMANHAATMASSHESGESEHGRGTAPCDCTCIGDCTMSAPLVRPPAVATLLVALVEPAPSRPIDADSAQAPPRVPDRLLPFANGPPSASV